MFNEDDETPIPQALHRGLCVCHPLYGAAVAQGALVAQLGASLHSERNNTLLNSFILH